MLKRLSRKIVAFGKFLKFRHRIPKSWKNITLDQFIRLQDIPKFGNSVTEFIHKMEILTDISSDEIREMNATQIGMVTKRLKFLEEIPEPKKQTSFKLKGKTYKTGDVDQTTVGQVIDIMQLNEEEKNAGQKMLNVLSVIYYNEEQGEEYDSDRMKFNQENLREMDVMTAMNSTLFFSIGLRSYLPNVLQDSLKRMNLSQMEKLTQETGVEFDSEDFEKFINGMTSFLDSQGIQFSTLKEHQN